MRIPKIYLETTVFNFYADSERFAHADTARLFKEIAEGRYLAYTSRSVIEELGRAPVVKRDEMINFITEYSIPILEYNDEAERLADIYVAEGVIPIKYRMDGLHIAIAAVNDLDMIISMNFQHIVKRKTIKMTANINTLNGYHAIEIYSPMEVVENETDE